MEEWCNKEGDGLEECGKEEKKGLKSSEKGKERDKVKKKQFEVKPAKFTPESEEGESSVLSPLQKNRRQHIYYIRIGFFSLQHKTSSVWPENTDIFLFYW